MGDTGKEQSVARELRKVDKEIRQAEAALLALVAAVSDLDGTDKRLAAIARTQFELGFLALDRALKPLITKHCEA